MQAAFFLLSGFIEAQNVGGMAHIGCNMQAWVDGQLVEVDPETVTFRQRDPVGTITTYVFGTDDEVVKDTTGDYHVDVPLDSAGSWTFRWESGGDYVQAEERELVVRETAFA